MTRTGSGKTAAFLIPLFEKLKASKSTGARAMILSPTRELPLQSLRKLEVPQFVFYLYIEDLNTWATNSVDLKHCRSEAANAYKQYLKSRAAASRESVKRCKEIKQLTIASHPCLGVQVDPLKAQKRTCLNR